MRLAILCATIIIAAAVHSQPLVLLDAEPRGADSALLKLIVLATGEKLLSGGSASIRFLADGSPVEQPAPGPRTAAAPMPASNPPADIRIVTFGPVTLPPGALDVQGRLGDGQWLPLGTLTRDENGPRLARACPAAPGEEPVITVAACEILGPRRFVIRVGVFNCGAQFAADLSAFLHFEPEPAGEAHATFSPFGLYPSARATDSRTWAADEITVVTFGPYSIPPDAPLPIYLRAGMYDRDGDGARARLTGADESSRVLLGRILDRDGRLVFQRAEFPEEAQR